VAIRKVISLDCLAPLSPAEMQDQRLAMALDMLRLVVRDGADLPAPVRRALQKYRTQLQAVRETLAAAEKTHGIPAAP
jgi:hypothetical protein